MTTQILLDVNSDDLFMNHTILEIKSFELQIHNEIEKKKEELRTMVGEKCRDLLNAADTITEMKITSQNFVAIINHTKQLCRILQEKRNIIYESTNMKCPKRFLKSSEEIAKIIEIKILLMLPEQIWSALDNKDYLLGAQLFLFATHLHLGLEICSNSQNISNKYPVLRKQWEVIACSKTAIINGACRELGTINISVQKAAECLGSLIFLERWSYEKLLRQFLEIRMLSLNDILKSEELSRKKLGQCVKLLQQTLIIIYICFLDKTDKRSLIPKLLDTITGHEEKPTLSKIIKISSSPEKYLSPLILNFRPKISSNSVLPPECVRKISCTWLEEVGQLLRVQLTKILLLIDDIKRLHNVIKQEVLEIKYPINWSEIIDSLLGVIKFDIYNMFIKSHVTNRIRELIQVAWQQTFTNVLIYLNEVDENIMKDRGKVAEKNMMIFMWKEKKNEVDESLKHQTLGYAPQVVELCHKMDSLLTKLLDDVLLYIEQDSVLQSEANENSDAKIILPFLNMYSLEMIQRFTHHIVATCKDQDMIEPRIVIRARFLKALASQSSGLKNCLLENICFEEVFEKKEDDSLWQQAVTSLNEGSIQIWQFWRVLVSLKLNRLIKNKLGQAVSIGSLLKSKLLTEIVTIEEQTEDGTNVKSDLRIPSQPSLTLQELLFQICHQLNAVAPHTLPRLIHQCLVDSFVKDILEHYRDWSESDVIYQSQAWQMLLDVRFITLLLVTKDNKDFSQGICETLEKRIDPFDFDVYFPHLQDSVKKSTQKLQGTFGVLINFSEKLPVFNGLKLKLASSNNKVEEPNLLATPASVTWFSLLPITNFGTRKQESSNSSSSQTYPFKDFPKDKTGVRTKERENKKESVTSDFFKSAGALFDAMTGGWT